MALSRPLVVAIVAGVALVATLAVDASMNRTIAVEIHDGIGWRTLVELGDSGYSPAYYEGRYGFVSGPIEVARNGTLDLRIRVDNGYPWAYGEMATIRVFGSVVATGGVGAEAFSSGESRWSIGVQPFFDQAAGPGKPLPAGQTSVGASIQIDLGGRDASVYFELKEATT